MATKRQLQKQATRRRLKKAVDTLCKTHNISEISPNQIAAEAGVASGTFYVHFTNKHEIVDEIVHDLDMAFQQTCVDTITSLESATIRETMTHLGATVIDFYQKRQHLTSLVMDHVSRHGHNKIVGTNAKMRSDIATFLTMLDDTLPPLRADLLAHAMQNLWRQMALRGVGPGEELDDVVAVLVDLTGALIDTVLPGWFDSPESLPIEMITSVFSTHMTSGDEEA